PTASVGWEPSPTVLLPSVGNRPRWQRLPLADRTPGPLACSIRLLNINVPLEFVYSNRSGGNFSLGILKQCRQKDLNIFAKQLT
ncbi:MAG: hypothetical protein IIY78_00500, partial [Clostridia bacterium]|nr:hypothetical protein [Clostridia bacterium]